MAVAVVAAVGAVVGVAAVLAADVVVAVAAVLSLGRTMDANVRYRCGNEGCIEYSPQHFVVSISEKQTKISNICSTIFMIM